MKNSLFILLAIITMASSCTKDPEVTPPGQDTRKLTVILNPVYLPLSAIDSAFITWQVGATTDTLRLTASGNDLAVAFAQLPQTKQRYQLHLFTKTQIRLNKLYWIKEFEVALEEKNALNIVAPLGLEDQNWLPRVVLNDQSGLMAFSGIRPADPYFRIHRIDRSWKKIIIDRSYWTTVGTDTKLTGGVWQGNDLLDATGSYENTSFFGFLPTQLGSQYWDHLELVLMFTNADNTQTRLLELMYTVE
jgi:hypothetical protein